MRVSIITALTSVLLASAALAQTTTTQTTTTQPAAEFRGMWVSRFEWPDPDEVKCKAVIDAIMARLAEHHFNAVMFQVRGQCDTFYPSPNEPPSPLISPDGKPLTWDPLAYALDAAHRHGLEFHAYINTHVAWQSARHEPPVASSHVYYRHANAADPAARGWLIHDKDGKPVQYEESNYVWLAPGVPAFQAYTREQIMYVVNNYDVDGLHFDRIRTPGAEYSYDPISVERQKPGAEGNPDDLEFADWTRNQITRFLCDLYAEIMEVKPGIKISSSPLGLYRKERYPSDYPASFQYGYSRANQDAQAWLAAGAMDFVAPQIYWNDGGRLPDFSHILPDWLAHRAGRHIYAGQITSMGPDELIHQVEVTRSSGGSGNVVFSFGSFDRRIGLARYAGPGGIYATKVPTPDMEWKSRPSEGIVLGTITDAETGEPVTDAHVRRTDSDYTALSSADGLYSFLKVPPGTCTLTVRKAGFGDRRIADVRVVAGKVTRVDAALGPPPAVIVAAEPVIASPRPEDGGHPAGGAEPGTDTSKKAVWPWVLLVVLPAGAASGMIVVFVFRRSGRSRPAATD